MLKLADVTPETPFTYLKNPDATYTFRCPKCGQIIHGLRSMAAMIYRGFGHKDKCLVATTPVSQHGADGPNSQ
jgi:hypothetical protein